MSDFYSTRVTYDRSKRRYSVRLGGDVFTYPAGAAGRQVAMRAAVLDADPALWAAVRRFTRGRPWLASRAWAAAELVLTGRVLRTAAGALVDGEGGAYPLQPVDGVIVCPCEDFWRWAAPIDESGQRWCKHVIAYVLSMEVFSDE